MSNDQKIFTIDIQNNTSSVEIRKSFTGKFADAVNAAQSQGATQAPTQSNAQTTTSSSNTGTDKAK